LNCRPFNDDSVEAIFNNIKRGHIEWPDLGNEFRSNYCFGKCNNIFFSSSKTGYEEDEMSPEAQDLIK